MPETRGFLSLGIDLGTTTVSAALVDIASGRQLAARTIPHAADLPTSQPFQHEQDADRILGLVQELLSGLCAAHPSIRAIGFTGQMHGIVYTNAAGHAVSPLYTWQDERAALPYAPGVSCCDEIARRTGLSIQPGYGFATHFYNALHQLVPEQAVSCATIMDYVVMRLTGRSRPLIHPSNAASLGLFDARKNAWSAALNELPAPLAWPQIASDQLVAGRYAGIPVVVAIGDNQASFFGSVREEQDAILLNYGTGSQVSLLDTLPDQPLPMGLERRPYEDGRFLLCGSALCGGRAYALLERFFRQFARALGQDEEQYERLNELAQQALAQEERLCVRTTFCGTRQDPTLRGQICGLGEDNFTPQALTLGVLQGMANELFDLLPPGLAAKRLIASGNAVRKNPALQQVLARTFGLPLMLPDIQEEAAFGAALFAACRSGQKPTLADAKSCIPYR